MVKRLVLAAVMGIVCGAAASAEDAVTPEDELVPVATQEICIMIDWGLDGVRTIAAWRCARRPWTIRR